MFQVSSEYARFPLHKFKFHYLVHCSFEVFLILNWFWDLNQVLKCSLITEVQTEPTFIFRPTSLFFLLALFSQHYKIHMALFNTCINPAKLIIISFFSFRVLGANGLLLLLLSLSGDIFSTSDSVLEDFLQNFFCLCCYSLSCCRVIWV